MSPRLGESASNDPRSARAAKRRGPPCTPASAHATPRRIQVAADPLRISSRACVSFDFRSCSALTRSSTSSRSRGRTCQPRRNSCNTPSWFRGKLRRPHWPRMQLHSWSSLATFGQAVSDHISLESAKVSQHRPTAAPGAVTLYSATRLRSTGVERSLSLLRWMDAEWEPSLMAELAASGGEASPGPAPCGAHTRRKETVGEERSTRPNSCDGESTDTP